MTILPPHAMAIPTGGQVAAGNVTFAGGSGTMDIKQFGNAAIVNWADFGIGAGEVVNILQSGPDAALLNRVLGANPSNLLGQLNANGRVLLINPNGIVVGKDASINAMEFMASTLDVADADFLNGGDLHFSGDSQNSVVNLGKITATNGDVILIAYKVANAGTIEAHSGVAALAAGQDVLLSPEADQRILIKTGLSTSTGPDGTGVDNSGVIAAAQAELEAAGGNLYELAINQTGFVRATGVEQKNGRVLLVAEGGTIAHSGTIAAQNADGSGGEVLIGGDYRGANAAVANAERTTVTEGAVIDVSATAGNANAGRAIVWADQRTDFSGKIEGQGGALGGNGAFAEVSGKHILNYTGLADLSAAFGDTGTLLLDPDQAIISTAINDLLNGVFNNTVLSNNLATANVVVDASSYGDSGSNTIGEIIVNAAVAWTSGNTLTLKAGNSITVNADLNGTGGDIDFQAMGVSSSDSVTVDAGATITANSLTIGQNADAQFVGFNPLPVPNRSINDITINGVLNVGTLDIKTQNAGIDGDISITNAANAIGTLTSSVTSGTIKGDVNIVDGSGGLIVDGDFSAVTQSNRFDINILDNVTSEHGTTIVTNGDLTLANGAKLGSSTGKDIVLAAQGGAFINNAGASAVTPGTGGRFLIYSNAPATTTAGGLVGTPVYNKSFAANAPGSITQTGSRFLYTLAPTLSFTADDFARLYGGSNPSLTFSMTGLVGGDTAGQAFTGTPSLATGALSSDNVGAYAITASTGSLLASDYDYQIAFAPGTLTINPAPVTITANDLAKTQGQPNPAFTASFTGLVNGDSASDFTGLLLSTSADNSSPVGTYQIIPTGAANANYDISFVNGTLTVNGQPTLLVSADDFAITYGATLPTFTSTISGFIGTDDASIVTGLILTSIANENSGVGSYLIVPSGATANGYAMDFANGTLTINPASLNIAANNISRFYGSNNPALTASFTGLVKGETSDVVSGLSLTTTAIQSSDIGDYVISASGATAANYNITFTAGTLTVDRAPLTITVDDLSKVYADLNPTLTQTTEGLVLGHTLADFSSFIISTAVTQFTDVGNYPVSASLTGALTSNYAVTINPGTMSITPRPVSAVLGSGTREYGDANPTITIGLFGDAPVGTSNFFINNITRGTTGTDATISSDVGTYATTVTDMTAANPNFDITVVPGTLTVTAAPLTIRAFNKSRLYGAANPVFTGTTTGLKLTDTLADVIAGTAFTSTATTTSNVGSYTITASGTALTNNYDITFTSGTLTVNKAPLFIAPALSSRLYGDADPTFTLTATGLLNGDTVDVVTQEQFSGSPPTAGAGTRTISILAATATNYVLSFGTGTMNILPRPLTITADDFSREYGEANPAFTASFNNLASFDTAADIPGVTVTTPATVASSVIPGGYALNVTSGTNANYDISYAPGLLTITPAPLLVQLGDISRLYGDTNADPTVTINTGFKLTDSIASLLLQLQTPASVTSDVGHYLYSATSVNPNYALQVFGGQLTVTPAPLSVGIADVLRNYGDENPATYDVSLGGLKFAADADDIVLVGNSTFVDTDVGTYAFTAQSLTDNYTITSVSGDILIAPRPLNLNFTGASRRYGDANPSEADLLALLDFTGVLAPGDTPADAFQVSTTADTFSNVGSYSIGINVINSNYRPGTVTGSLAVTPRPLSVVLSNIERVYGQSNPTSFQSFLTTSGANDLLSFTPLNTVLDITAPAATSDVGSYSLNANLINSNYTLSLFSGTMTINPRQIILQLPDGFTRFYGESNPDLAPVTVFTPANANAGLASFDTVDDVVSFDLPDERASTGVYELGTSFNSNYDVQVPVSTDPIVIEARPLLIALPASYSRLYGVADPSLGLVVKSGAGSVSGIASFDTLADVATLQLPGVNANAGTYALGVTLNNPNYALELANSSTATINQRVLKIAAFQTYGDDTFQVTNTGGNGFASFDNAASQLELTFLSAINADSSVGYYGITSFGLKDTVNYRISADTPQALVVFPRQVGLTINSQTFDFADVAALNAFIANQNLVVDATASNLRTGDTIDDAFPIIRYQVVESDQVPALPVVPTLDNIVYPTLAALQNNPSLQGTGLTLKPTATSTSTGNVTPTKGGFTNDGGFVVNRFLTVFDGFNTEPNYLLTSVVNANVTFKIPAVAVNTTNSEGSLFDLANVTLTQNADLDAIKKAEANKTITVTSADTPPGLAAFIFNDDPAFGIDLIEGYFQSMLASGQTYEFEEGSLFYEIARSTGGNIEDITPFRIQRWMERNADNPEALALLAEPLSLYATKFLEKDPASYTGADTQFATVLGAHMQNARDQLAEKVEAKHDAWLDAQSAEGAGKNLTTLYGQDVPWTDFISEAAGQYVEDDIGAKIALTAGSTAAGAGATGAIVAGLTSFILPNAYLGGAAVGSSIIAGGTTMGGAVVGTSTGASIVVAAPVAIVAVAIAGSIARGVQVFENAEQKEIYEGIVGGIGSSIKPGQFSLTDAKGDDNTYNQAILLGALSSMLFAN